MLVCAEVFRNGRPRIGIPHFYEESRIVARQPQSYSRLIVLLLHGLYRVGYQL